MSDDPKTVQNTGLERIRQLETEALTGTCENYVSEPVEIPDQMEMEPVDSPDQLACKALIRTTDPDARAALLNSAAVRLSDAENPWDVSFQDAVIVGEIALKLNTQDLAAYQAATLALANNGSGTAVEYLASALIGDPNPEHRIDALHALATIREETDETNDNPGGAAKIDRINEYLEDALRNDPVSDVSRAALDELANAGMIEVVVNTVLESTDNGTQIAAIKRITATAGEEVAVSTLKAFLFGKGEGRDAAVKIEAARELGKIGTEEARQALSRSYTAQSSFQVKTAIEQALSRK